VLQYNTGGYAVSHDTVWLYQLMVIFTDKGLLTGGSVPDMGTNFSHYHIQPGSEITQNIRWVLFARQRRPDREANIQCRCYETSLIIVYSNINTKINYVSDNDVICSVDDVDDTIFCSLFYHAFLVTRSYIVDEGVTSE
jgi:hypothetical protein